MQEPVATGWRTLDTAGLLEELFAGPPPAGRPRILAIDGRSGAGKSTLAERIERERDGVVLVRTDDLAWYQPMFEWGDLLRDGVLLPLRAGRDVRLRPAVWDERGRPGGIVVPASASLVVVEGVGANQRAAHGLVDAAVWVRSDPEVAERRGLARDIASGVNGDAGESAAFWRAWAVREAAFLDLDRPWERADLVVDGTADGSGVRVASARR